MKIEAIRRAELEREDLDLSDKFDAAIYAMWYLMDPLDLGRSKSIGTSEYCEKELTADQTGKLKFTAHAHSSDPISESPDDVHIYSVIGRLGHGFIHFIMDRFRIFRIK